MSQFPDPDRHEFYAETRLPEQSAGRSKAALLICLAAIPAVAFFVAAAVILLVWQPWRVPPLEPRPEESAEEKFREAAAAFGGGKTEFDAGESAAIRTLFRNFHAHMQAGEDKELEDLFDAQRMYQETRRIGGFANVSPLEEQKLVRRLQQTFGVAMVQNAQVLKGDQWKVKSCRLLTDPSEALVYARLDDPETGPTKWRWWLKQRDGAWRIYDFEELNTGIRMSDMFVVVVQEGQTDPRRAAERKRAFLRIKEACLAYAAGDLSAVEEVFADLRDDVLPERLQLVCWLIKAALHVGQERYEEALALCRRAEAVDPDLPLLHFIRASTYNGLGQHAAAKKAAERYLEQLGSDADGYLQLAAALVGLERHEEALAAYRLGLDDDPNSTDNHSGVIRSLVRLKRFDDAGAEADRLAHRTDDPFYPTLVHAARGNVEETAGGLARCVEAGYSAAEFYDDDILGPALRSELFHELAKRYPEPKDEDDADRP
jgi:tetratricopeptide (TPR) repeat protein